MAFEDELKKAKANIYKEMVKTVRGGFIAAVNTIIEESPVDTGRFRGNWQASVNAPRVDIVEQAEKRKENVVGNTSNYTLDGSLFLTNNLPYAQRLENGWSKQRGSGWVAATVAKAKIAIQNNLDNL